MIRPERPNLPAFLGKVRNRLWLDRARDLLERSLWWSAGIVLVAGLVHALGRGLPWQASAFAAVAPVAIALALAAYRRPSLETAAVVADRKLGVRDLFVSASDQLSAAPARRPGASAFVLQQAERAVAAAATTFPGIDRRRISPRVLAPMAMAFAGLFLHLTPETPNGLLARWLGAPETQVQTAPPTERSSSPLLSELRKALSKSPDQVASAAASKRPARARPVRPTSSGRALGPEGSREAEVRRSEQPSGADRLPSEAAPHGPATGDAAGMGAPADSSGAHVTESFEPEVAYVDMQRPAGDAGRSRDALPLAEEMPRIPDTSGSADPHPPGARATSMQESALRPALASYARRYFIELERSP